MNIQPALSTLSRIEEFIDAAESSVQGQGKSEFWKRDKAFLQTGRECLLSKELDRMRWLFDQMRNLSQGFGSYCSDLKTLDGLLDELFLELETVVTDQSRSA